MNIFTLFQRAQAGHDLTPPERAFFKFVQAVGYIIVLNALVAVFQYLNNTHGTVDVAKLAEYAGAQIGLALALAIGKYFSAHGDATLGGYIEMIVDEVIGRLPAQPAPVKPIVPEEHPPVAAAPLLPVPAHILAATPAAITLNPPVHVPAYLGDIGPAPAQPAESTPVTPVQPSV